MGQNTIDFVSKMGQKSIVHVSKMGQNVLTPIVHRKSSNRK